MISKDELTKLISAKIITAQQAQKIWQFQNKSDKTNPSFHFANTLYYLGGFVIVFAISYFLGTNWEKIGDFGRIFSSLILMILFGGLGIQIRKTEFKVAASLLLLIAVVAVPLFIHSVERGIGLWPPQSYPGDLSYQHFLDYINTAWIVLDILTLIISSIVFYIFKEPILTLPIAHFFWFLLLDATNFLNKSESFSFDRKIIVLKSVISIIAGVILVIWGIYYYKKEDNRVGIWPWIYGLLIIQGALITLRWEAESFKIFYQILILLFGIGLLAAATPLRSKTFLTFGALSTFWFLQDISWTYFRESLGFSISLGVSGFITIIFGILIQKYYKLRFSNPI